jgi:hypothetical protein
MKSKTSQAPRPLQGASDLAKLHLRVGWWSLLLFLTVGLLLETLSGFKAGFYVDVSSSTRRLMWTLAHAHGTLLSILNVVFAMTLPMAVAWPETSRTLASRCLRGALVLMPLGFFLGGVRVYGGDPGIGVLLVPPGALLLFVAVLLTARSFDGSAPEKKGAKEKDAAT